MKIGIIQRIKANKRQFIWWLLLAAFFVVQLVIIGEYQYKHYLDSPAAHSDAAAEILLAEHLHETGEWVLSDSWFYSTETRVLHNQLLMRPFFAITDDYALARTGGSLLAAILIVAAGYFCFSSLEIARVKAFAASLLFILPYGMVTSSHSIYDSFIGTGYYSFFLINALLFFGLWLHFKRAEKRWQKRTFLGLLLVLCVLVGLCGMRYIILVIMPLLLSELVEWLVADRTQTSLRGVWHVRKWELAALGLVVVCWGIGYLIDKRWIQPLYPGSWETVYSNTESIVNNAVSAANSFFGITGFNTYEGVSIMTPFGIMMGFFLVYNVFLIGTFVLLLKNIRCLPPFLRRYMVIVLSYSICNLAACILMRDGLAVRYVCLSLILLLPLPVFYFAMIPRLKVRKLLVLVLVVAMVVAANVQMAVLQYPYDRAVRLGFPAETAQSLQESYVVSEECDRFLIDNGYSFGWATFWVAGATTVRNDGIVRVANISEVEDGYRYQTWLMPKEYADIQANPPQFLLMTRGEYSRREEQGLPKYGTKVFENESYIVYDVQKDIPPLR